MAESSPPTLALDGFDALPPDDQAAIGSALAALLGGFTDRDADLLAGVYADDADWVNAFGTVKRGRSAILDHLRGLFVDANFDAGELVAPPESTLRRLTDEIVTVSTHLRVTGQGLVGGGTIPVRDNRSLRILQRQPDGRWLIVSEMYMDARTDETYAGASST